MRKKHNYIFAKYRCEDEFSAIVLMCNGGWFYVMDIASLMLFDEIVSYFKEYHGEAYNNETCIPDKILFDCSRRDLLVSAYDGRRCMDSVKWRVLKKRIAKNLDSDMLRFVNFFTPLGLGSAE